MPHPDLFALRSALGCRTWTDLARQLGVHWTTVYRWRAGKEQLPGPVMALIRHLVSKEEE